MSAHAKYRLTCEFALNDTSYIAWIIPYYDMSDVDILTYQVQYYTYIVHVFSMEGFKTFELFLNDENRWTTNASALLVDNKVGDILNIVMSNLAS